MDHPFRPLFVEHPPERMAELRRAGRPVRVLAFDAFSPLLKLIYQGPREARTDTGSG